MLIDTHVHYGELSNDEISELLQTAHAQNVTQTIAVASCLKTSERAVELAEAFPQQIFAAVGIDRDQATQFTNDEISGLTPLAKNSVAIGECGLDYCYAPETATQQKKLFEAMLALADQTQLPTIVHTRDSDEDTLAILKDHINTRKGGLDCPGVIHCFTREKTIARKCLDLGFYLSFSGILTFRNADMLRDVAKYVPLDRILIETDSPYLAPIPHRGKTNQPAFVVEVAKQLAETLDLPLEKIAEITTQNAQSLFKI